MPPLDDPSLHAGFVRLHVLHHAARGEIHGQGIARELARRGHRIGAGTLYPLLHGLEARGYLRSRREPGGRRIRRLYRATPRGRRALARARSRVRDLLAELLGGA
jgi:DNA-binding PadR family transcriptional regulator